MAWEDAPDRTPDEILTAQQRQQIRAAVPYYWALHHNRLTYGFESADQAGGAPLYGVCGHNQVCLYAGSWIHPYPLQPHCDEPPARFHSGIL